jgi:hypothetical protein
MTMDLLDRLPALEQEAEEFERKARALRQIIEGVRTLNGDAAQLLGIAANGNGATTVSLPRGRAAVRSIVSQKPGIWKMKEIKRAAQRGGYPISPTGIEKAVMRMAEAGEAERTGYGEYDFSNVQGVLGA